MRLADTGPEGSSDLRAARDVELLQHTLGVPPGSVLCHTQSGGDVAVAASCREEECYLRLSGGQAMAGPQRGDTRQFVSRWWIDHHEDQRCLA
jgi:hypothetical protein